jgi:hypothetical protein
VLHSISLRVSCFAITYDMSVEPKYGNKKEEGARERERTGPTATVASNRES